MSRRSRSRSRERERGGGSRGEHRRERSRDRDRSDHKRRDSRSSRSRERDEPPRHRRRSRSRERGGDAATRDHHRRRSGSRERERRRRRDDGASPERRRGGGEQQDRNRDDRLRHMYGKDEEGGDAAAGEEGAAVEKEGPNFETSGKLLEDTNVFNGVVIKYSEPPEAKKPKKRWRFYCFKGEEALPTLHLHRQSAFLMGKDRKVVDIPVDHPSCSRQHAVLQYRLVSRRVTPYIIDLDSSNGTYLNNKRIDPRRYYELKEKDVLKFGYSTREYVLLHEGSQDDDEEDGKQ